LPAILVFITAIFRVTVPLLSGRPPLYHRFLRGALDT
jgi:hypothetical protein